MPHDVFISYARKDNQPTSPPSKPGDPESPGWISAFIDALKEEYQRATGGRELEVYLDTEEIRSMDNWERHIFRHLRESKILLAFLSPNYFASAYCRKEWEAWIEHEISKHILSEGIAPIYFVEVPGFPDAPAAQIADWVENFKRRQWHIDLRAFVPEGLEALRQEGLRAKLAELEQQIRERAGRVERAAASPNEVPDYNPCFVGRLGELNRLFDVLFSGRVGVVATVHGLGGMGKSELAYTYAHAFAHEYPGGRYSLRAAGREDLREVLCDLAPYLDIHFSDAESKNSELRFHRLRAGLDRWTRERGRVLLVLDNVDRRQLLAKEQTDSLNLAQDRVHLLATTRLTPPPGALSAPTAAAHQTAAWLALDELPTNAAVRLLEKHRPFATPAEADAARSIAEALGGFTLAVEIVAIHLANEPEVTYTGFLNRLRAQILPTLDDLGTKEEIELRRHNEKLLAKLLQPTLDSLAPPERLAVQYAALLPADQLPLPWLRALVSQAFPEMGQDGDGSRPTPWNRLVRQLLGLRLMQSTSTIKEDSRPLLVRAHRLVQDVVRRQLSPPEIDKRQGSIQELVSQRDSVLEYTTQWTQALWEVEPLDALASLWADQNLADAAWLLNQVACRWHHLGEWARAEPLMRRALNIDEQSFGPEHPYVAIRLNNLAQLLSATNRLMEAEPLMRRALAIDEQSFGPEHPNVARDLNNLADLLQDANRLKEAEPLMRRALAIVEQTYGPEHPKVAIHLNNLSQLLQATNRLPEAEPLMRRALAIDEQSFGPEHPKVAIRLNNLAQLLKATNRLQEAEPLMRRALAIDEESFGPEHPKVAIRLNNLAGLLKATNRLPEAEPLMRRALGIDEQSYGPDHPKVAIRLNNLAQLLKATNRLPEAESLMRRHVAIFLQFTRATGHPHPHLQAAVHNYAGLLGEMGHSEAEILARLRKLAPDFFPGSGAEE